MAEKWEYQRVLATQGDLQTVLQRFDGTDWELVGVVPAMYEHAPPGGGLPTDNRWWVGGFNLIFKRRKQ